MVGYVLVFLLGVVFDGVGVAFFCMAADLSSVRPSGEVLDFTGHRHGTETRVASVRMRADGTFVHPGERGYENATQLIEGH